MGNLARTSARSLLALGTALTLVGCAGVDAGTSFSVSSTHVQLTGCPTSASPLPGWVNCTGTITLNFVGTPSSGYLSAYMNYGSSGSFYHGQATVFPGATSVTMNVVDDYVAQCFTSVQTTVDVYNGPQTNQNAPLVASIPITISGSC